MTDQLKKNPLKIYSVAHLQDLIRDNRLPIKRKVRLQLPCAIYNDGREEITKLIDLIDSGQCPAAIELSINICDTPEVNKLMQSITSKNCPAGITLELSHGNTNVEPVIVNLLTHPDCPKNLHLLLNNTMFSFKMDTIFSGLLDANIQLPQGLDFEFYGPFVWQNRSFTHAFIALLNSDKFMPGTTIVINSEELAQQYIEQIKNALIGNTNVRITINNQENMTLQQKETIQYCNIRNQALYQYPIYDSIIKQLCANHGFYNSQPPKIESLKMTMTQFLMFHPKCINNRDIKLPHDLKKELNKLISIKNWLNKQNVQVECARYLDMLRTHG